MGNTIFSEKQAFSFLKVEDYFSRYQEWNRLESVDSHAFDSSASTLTLNFRQDDGFLCSMLIHLLGKNTLRIRFNPGKKAEDYAKENSRAVVQNTIDDLKRLLAYKESFQSLVTENENSIEIVTVSENSAAMRVVVSYKPFSIEVFRYSGNSALLVWQTADIPIFFTPNGKEDFAIIQAVSKPACAKYIGFGEQGGLSLSKNTAQLNYFNFDNMRYRQVYDRGPLELREPLYHSDPFFMEFNGSAETMNVYGLFIDNPSQIMMDIGYLNTSRYMFGTRFGDLDFYLFTGSTPADVINRFTSVVGKSHLKPRYCLGYHQGCYGYENRASLEWVASKYRQYGIPLDGLHIDVDMQDNYKTFTIDTSENKFPDPASMFSNLKNLGIKCSTNITPVISKQNTAGYATYNEAALNDFFIRDYRYDPDNPDSRNYQLYGGAKEYCPNQGWVEGFNSGEPFIGGVYYGNNAMGQELGTPGHYADLGKKEVRRWWGRQYEYLFDMGLEMVWQDMTTPAIRDNRGDMKGFPFRLQVTDDFRSETTPKQTPAIKVWNLYSYNLHKATYHGLNNLPDRSNKRNFIIGRGSYTGSHRFAGLWTGDNSSDWDFLKVNISQALSLGMCGVVINGQDIGGFEASADGGKWADPELMIRWTAAGAFLPWFRNHYVRKGRKEFQEPFMYVEWFNQYRGGVLPEPCELYRMVLPVCRHYIELRYRLLQLFYDALFENTLTGLPICRPLFLNDPKDGSLYNDKAAFLDDEFFVGKDLLVAPVLEPQAQGSYNNFGKRDVYLPWGSSWYCFMDNTMPLGPAVDGGTTVRDFDASLNTEGNHMHFIVPLYVRAGAIIPTIELEQYVGQRNEEGKACPVTLNIYPGAKGEYTMYLDDGVSRSSADVNAHPREFGGDEMAKSEYRKTRITHSYTDDKTRRIRIERIHDGYTPKFEPFFFVAILHDPGEMKGANGCLKSIRRDGKQILFLSGASPDERSARLWESPDSAWYYNENINISFIKVIDDSADIVLEAICE